MTESVNEVKESGTYSKTETISKKDIYNRLWAGRDFEIEHLWQRSIFLGAFLVLFFTVYFAVIGSFFDNEKDSLPKYSVISTESTVRGTTIVISEKEDEGDCDYFAFLHDNPGVNIILLTISLLGSSFSLLWIFMAKGSKYWYEKYEASIDFIEKDEGLFDDVINDERRNEEEKAEEEHREPEYLPIQGYLKKGKSNDSVFSLQGGAYSMSKVNISIGIIFSIFWFPVLASHLILIFCSTVNWIFIIAVILLAIAAFCISALIIGNINRGYESDVENPLRVISLKKREDKSKDNCRTEDNNSQQSSQGE